MWKWAKRIFSAKRTVPRIRPEVIFEAYERPLARILAEVGEYPVHAIESLEVAQKTANAFVVMEGDWGGQIYLTAPVSLLSCSAADLAELLTALDSQAWECNQGEGCGFFFESHEPGDGISGGMGGGATTHGLWLHPELEQSGFGPHVRSILFGENRA